MTQCNPSILQYFQGPKYISDSREQVSLVNMINNLHPCMHVEVVNYAGVFTFRLHVKCLSNLLLLQFYV